MITNRKHQVSDDCINAGVNLLLLKSEAHCNIRDLTDAASTIAKAQEEIAKAMATIEAISEVISGMGIKRIESALGHIQNAKHHISPTSALSQEPEVRRFALDRATRDEIRYRRSIGVPMGRLAEDFGVSRRTVGRYVDNAN